MLEFKPDFLKKPVSSCSKGMYQRVSMARALVSNPRLLFLDEPTSGLDPSGAVLFRRIIEQKRKKGTTVFVTTHNMMDADLLCDRVASISNRNIVALDTPKRLKEKNSNHRVVIDYLYQGRRETKTVEASELEAGIPFAHDGIVSIHFQEPTLEDMFIKYTGRGCPDVERFCSLFKKDCRMLLSGKFFLIAIGFLALYTAYVNLGYIRFMQMPPYAVYLYDPAGTQSEVSPLVHAVPSMEAMDQALLADANGAGLDASNFPCGGCASGALRRSGTR